MGRKFVRGAITCLLVLSPGFARGQAQQAGVSVQIDPCVPIDRERFHRQLAIELGDAIDYLADSEKSSSHVSVSLSCVTGGVQLRLEDSVTRKSMSRIVDLAQVEAEARTRLMALTVAEFLVASWLELRLPKQPVVAPVGPEPASAVTRAASRALAERLPPSPRLWQLEAAFDLLLLGDAYELIPALTLRVLHRLSDAFALGIGAQLGWGELSGTLQNPTLGPQPVEVRLNSASLLASVLYTRRFGSFEASAGLGWRFGMAYFSALTQAREAKLLNGSAYLPWGGPAILLGLCYWPTAQLRTAASFEAGVFVQRASAEYPEHVDVVQLDGFWFGASLGSGWAF